MLRKYAVTSQRKSCGEMGNYSSCSSGQAAQIPIGNLDTGQRQPVTLQSQTNQPRTLRLTSAPTGDINQRESSRLTKSQSFQIPTTGPVKMANPAGGVMSTEGMDKTDNSDGHHLNHYSQSFSDLSSNIQADQEELQALRREVYVLRQELSQCKSTISKLSDRETKLQDKMSEHAQRHMQVSSKFEDLTLGDTRPTQLIRRYGNLYSEARLDAFDALDDLPEISDLDDLKGKLLFSIVVLAFRSVQTTLASVKSQMKRVLCMPDDISHNAPAKEVDNVILTYLRKTVDQFDLSANLTEVCNQVWVTLYDYPGLKTCLGLKAYIEDCIRVSWGLSVQSPGYVIKYDAQTFDARLYTRFHASNVEESQVKSVLWPALLEGESGPCVHKGVIMT